MIIPGANVILRFLLDDDRQMAALATEAFERGVSIPNEVLAEVVFVLQKVYAMPRRRIADIIQKMTTVRTIHFESRPVLRHALRLYAERSLDFVDTLLIARNHCTGEPVMPIDKQLHLVLRNNTEAD